MSDIDSILMPPPPPKRPRSNCIVEEPSYLNNKNDCRIVPTVVSPPPNGRGDNRKSLEGSINESSFTPKMEDNLYNDAVGSSQEEMTVSRSFFPTTAKNLPEEPFNDMEEGYVYLPNEQTTDGTTILCTTSGTENNSDGTHTRRLETAPVVSTRFEDIVGHGAAKLRIDEMLLPLALPPALANSVLTGVRALPASILLYGPPGCGKTQLARAIAGEAEAALLSVGPSDVLSKFVGESEAAIKCLFKTAYERARAVESQCTVLFFDEIDALGYSRGRGDTTQTSSETSNCSRQVLAEILIQLTHLSNGMMDDFAFEEDSFKDATLDACLAIEEGADTANTLAEESASSVFPDQLQSTNQQQQHHQSPPRGVRLIVVAATNRPEDCDSALLRRFAIRVFVGLPSKRDRKKIVGRLLQDIDHTLTTTQLDQIATETQDWSGSDLEALTREAAMAPVRECLRSVALLKAKSHKRKQQRGGDEPSQEKPDEEANKLLLRGFENLRPVTLQDFEQAAEFWLGNQDSQLQTNGGTLGHKKCPQVHYDSESSSDEGEDD